MGAWSERCSAPKEETGDRRDQQAGRYHGGLAADSFRTALFRGAGRFLLSHLQAAVCSRFPDFVSCHLCWGGPW